MTKRAGINTAPRQVPRGLTIQEYTKRTLNFVERLRIEASKMELGEKRRRQREGDTSQQKLRVAPRVMVLGECLDNPFDKFGLDKLTILDSSFCR